MRNFILSLFILIAFASTPCYSIEKEKIPVIQLTECVLKVEKTILEQRPEVRTTKNGRLIINSERKIDVYSPDLYGLKKIPKI